MRYLLNFSYDGSYYYGFNKQTNKKTVQGELEKLLSKRFNKEISIYGCSRTDAKVHSLDSYAHFDIEEDVDLDKLKNFLNRYLNGECYIKFIKKTDERFHARYDVKKKTYMYLINVGEYNPTEKNTILQYCKNIDLKLAKKVCKKLVGKKSFKAFTPASNEKESYVREIYEIKILKKANYVCFYITGDGFLRYMIRNIMGLIIDVNEGTKTLNEIDEIIKSEDRRKSGNTAPPHGLYLYRVYY